MTKKFINCTPHVIRLNDGREFEPSGNVARVSTHSTDFNEDGICKTIYGDVEGLPFPQENTFYIVSLLVFNASNRADIVAPATSHPDVVRVDGQVYSVPGFVGK